MSSHFIPLSLLAVSSPDAARDVLESRSEFWFVCLLISSAGVALGCLLEIGETWSDFRKWLVARKDPEASEEDKSWHKPLAAIGLLLVILGVVGEGIAEGFTSIAETALRQHDAKLLGVAFDRATKAEEHSASAILEAGSAKDSAKDAADASVKANGASSSAVALATGARREADAYARDIAGAKQQAADAVSRLADAERRLADSTQREAAAETKLSAIKTPRSLINTNELVTALKPFKGTEYAFNVFQDDESIQFTKDMDTALGKAGWIRKQPGILRIGITALNVFSSERKDLVEVCIATGVLITLHSETPDALVKSSLTILPMDAQAALTLRNQLGPHITPNEEHNAASNVTVDPAPGKGPMLICVGKKP